MDNTVYKIAKLLCKDLFSNETDESGKKKAKSLIDSSIIDANREKYKYTGLAEIFDENYTFAETEIAAKMPDIELPDVDAVKIFTVNGICFEKEICTDSGFVYSDITTALNSPEYGEIAQKYYSKLADRDDFPTALNMAVAVQGIFVYLKPEIKAAKPLIIINLTDTQTQKPAASAFHNLLVFGENSSADIMVYNLGFSEIPTATNAVSETVIGKNANINILHLTEAGLQAKQVFSDYHKQYENSVLTHTNLVTGGALIRRNTEVQIAEKHCTGNLFGLSLAKGRQHIDNHTFIDHQVSESESRELYKSIVDDKAVNVFNGRILVRKDAQKTFAYQSNKNILLNTGGKIYTKPQLEIYADDVKCSHGATVGQLNEEALFYMQARGISKQLAQQLILSGFANETLTKIARQEFYDFAVSRIEKYFLIKENIEIN